MLAEGTLRKHLMWSKSVRRRKNRKNSNKNVSDKWRWKPESVRSSKKGRSRRLNSRRRRQKTKSKDRPNKSDRNKLKRRKRKKRSSAGRLNKGKNSRQNNESEKNRKKGSRRKDKNKSRLLKRLMLSKTSKRTHPLLSRLLLLQRIWERKTTELRLQLARENNTKLMHQSNKLISLSIINLKRRWMMSNNRLKLI